MFQDIVYSISGLESGLDDYGHRFLANVFIMGYNHLVRSIHLRLELRDGIVCLGYAPDDDAILFEKVDLLCELLVQHSGPCRRLFIDMLLPSKSISAMGRTAFPNGSWTRCRSYQENAKWNSPTGAGILREKT
jgi:hypothetical protein